MIVDKYNGCTNQMALIAVHKLPAESVMAEIIKSKAAIAWGPGQPLSVEEVDVMPPKAGEVRGRVVATGVCHTDAFTLSGGDPEGNLPAILGHAGGRIGSG